MHGSKDGQEEAATKRFTNVGLSVAIWTITSLIFWPIIRWLAQQTLASEQLLNAFSVLAFAAIVLMREHPHPIRFQMGRAAGRDLTVAFVAMGAALLLGRPVLALVGFCFVLSAAAFFLFGSGIAREVYSLLAAFAAFVIFALVLPTFDWPLRQMAGSTSAWLLGFFGHSVELGVAARGAPVLLLVVNGRVFEVAAECNGFGLISSSIMLAVLLTLYRRIAVFDKLLCIGIAALIALFFNSLRILVICLLAPHVGDHYGLMHETAGLAFFAAGLALVWWIIAGMPEKPRKAPSKAE